MSCWSCGCESHSLSSNLPLMMLRLDLWNHIFFWYPAFWKVLPQQSMKRHEAKRRDLLASSFAFCSCFQWPRNYTWSWQHNWFPTPASWRIQLSLLRGNGLPAPCFSVLPRVGALAIFYLRAWGIIMPIFFLCSPTQKDNRWFLQPWIQLASVHSHSFSWPHPLSLLSLQIQHLYNEYPILNLFLKIPGVVYVF